jgi:MerR family transcriptional regulator, copper efflux regulator
MGENLLRIGELASRASVSKRTVDFYTGLGLLAPAGRSTGNFRLYDTSAVQRIATIRRLEARGLRLDEITHLLTEPPNEDSTRPADPSAEASPADPVALVDYLSSLEVQVHALRDQPPARDHETRRVLATLVARAHVLMATALLLSEELVPGAQLLPPL